MHLSANTGAIVAGIVGAAFGNVLSSLCRSARAFDDQLEVFPAHGKAHIPLRVVTIELLLTVVVCMFVVCWGGRDNWIDWFNSNRVLGRRQR